MFHSLDTLKTKVLSSVLYSSSITRWFNSSSSPVDPKKKISSEIKKEIYNIFNHNIPLETSKIKNTFGLKLIDLFIRFKDLRTAFIRSHTPIVIKTLLVSEFTVYVYNNYIRKHLMLSNYYKDSFKTFEQKLMQSHCVKFLSKETLPQLAIDSFIYYFIGKYLYITNASLFYKTITIGVIGSFAASKLNRSSRQFVQSKFKMTNCELYPNSVNLIPNMLVASTCFDLFDLLIPYRTKYICGLLPIDKKFFLGYFYITVIGRLSKFISIFTSPAMNLASSEGVTAVALSLLIGNRKGYLMPFMFTHYFNPYTLWIFIKTRNNMYQNELDKLYSNKTVRGKIKTLMRFTTLNSMSYMLDI